MFRRLATDLDATTPDSGLVLLAAEAQLIGRMAMAAMIDDGLVAPDGRRAGEARRHPMMMVWKQAAEVRLAALRELGGSPLARLRLPEPDDEADNLAAMLGVWQVADDGTGGDATGSA